LINAIASIYASLGDTDNLTFFEAKLEEVDGYESIQFFDTYLDLLFQAEDHEMRFAGLDRLEVIAGNQVGSPWRRLAGFKTYTEALQAMKASGRPELTERIEKMSAVVKELKAGESNKELRAIFHQIYPGE